MLACRINNILVMVFSVVTMPLQFVTTFIGGCLVGCTFGLLLLPMSAIWLVLLGLLLGTSWLWERAEVLRVPVLISLIRIPLAAVGIVLALIAEIYVALMPSMGDLESRFTKLIMCWVWPFTLDYWRFSVQQRQIDTPSDQDRYNRLVRALRIAGVNWPEQYEFP